MKQKFTTPELNVVRFPVCINTLTDSGTLDPGNCPNDSTPWCEEDEE